MPPVQGIDNDPDTIRLLITTDNHVGYCENDAIRGDDSWKTFEEITALAKERDVDMIIQGGDLFHVNKPSKKSMLHVIRSLKRNCFGDRPCQMELISDPSLALGKEYPHVNYEDPNLNISVPVFAISGNHDDATGLEMLSPLDLLAASGLLNYFGKVTNNEDITVAPLLFKKGDTQFALYGLGNIKDERLYRMFRDGNVKFLKPSNELNENWFNLLCVHQNHTPHTRTSYLPEEFIPDFMDFVVWGHEHECIPHPVFNPHKGFDTLQPGSSIATSLSDSEANQKNVFIISVKKKSYSFEAIPLKTVRPFIVNEVCLQSEGFVPGPASKEDISRFLVRKIEELVLAEKERVEAECKSGSAPDADTKHPLPLIRLKVESSGDYELENPRRFSNRFVGNIANINDVVHFYKKRAIKEKPLAPEKTKFSEIDGKEIAHKASGIKLQDLMSKFLNQTELSLITEDGINNAVKKSLDNEDKYILNEYVKNSIKQETNTILSMNIGDDQDIEGGAASKVIRKALSRIKAEKQDNSHRRGREEKSANGIKINTAKSQEVIISESESDIEFMDKSHEDAEDFNVMSTKEMPKPKEQVTSTNKKSGSSSRSKRVRDSNKSKSTSGGRSLLDDIMNLGGS